MRFDYPAILAYINAHMMAKPAHFRLLRVALLFALLLCAEASARADGRAKGDEYYARLLSTYVRDGLVDYKGLKDNRQDMDAALRAYAEVTEREFTSWTIPYRLAYLINVHNLTVLKIIVDKYPIPSIRKAGGWFAGNPFDWRSITLFGHKISLNIMVRNYMIRDYAEPGALLALCQGARASPPLRAEPYVGERFYDQMLDQARVFLARAPYNRIDTQRRRMTLSPLFKWYGAEFARAAGSVERYVRMITPPEWGVRNVSGRFAISYSDFDWRLNDIAPQRK